LAASGNDASGVFRSGSSRVAQRVAAYFHLNCVATGSLSSMDVLDQRWWAQASLILARPRWLAPPMTGATIASRGAVTRVCRAQWEMIAVRYADSKYVPESLWQGLLPF
jgi:hypothetical protein